MITGTAIPFVQWASHPVRAGNSVRPLIDGEPAFRRIYEAIESARQSVWLTVTFMWPTFKMPDGRGSTFDVLDRAAARGIDVRVIFWRPDQETASLRQNAFWGSKAHIGLLNDRQSGVKIRWDRAHPGFCQHQKSWLIDAGSENEIAFVGGINLNPHSMVAPGHNGEGHNHDVYVELAGPSTVDVNHNFVQRWNEASERLEESGCWGAGSQTNLPFPAHIPPARGNAAVQLQRTIHPGRYLDGQSTPGGTGYPIASGERSNFDQYCSAINAAQRTIYLEHHSVEVPEIVNCLHSALKRGVDVILLMPAEPGISLPVRPERLEFLKVRATLGAFDNFLLAGIAGTGADGCRKSIYVHAKLMLVDDEWATAGSCNLHRFSLFGNGEMNVAFAEPHVVHAFRCELFSEHLHQDTSYMNGRGAFQLFRKIAKENRQKFSVGDHAWQGLAYELDITNYLG